MTMPVRLVLSILLALLAPAAALAHGSHASFAVEDAVVVVFDGGHGGDANAWNCSVLAPGGDAVWTEGRADAAGRFAFVPDRTGTWRVRGFGADGHGAEVVVEVDAAMLARLTGSKPDGAHDHDHAHEHQAAAFAWPAWAKLVLGVSWLCGVFGLVALLKVRKA